MRPQHECVDAARPGAWDLLAACPGEGLGTGTTLLLVAVLLAVLGGLGFGIWWIVRRMRGY